MGFYHIRNRAGSSPGHLWRSYQVLFLLVRLFFNHLGTFIWLICVNFTPFDSLFFLVPSVVSLFFNCHTCLIAALSFVSALISLFVWHFHTFSIYTSHASFISSSSS